MTTLPVILHDLNPSEPDIKGCEITELNSRWHPYLWLCMMWILQNQISKVAKELNWTEDDIPTRDHEWCEFFGTRCHSLWINSIKLMMTSLPVIMYDVNSSEPDVTVCEIIQLNWWWHPYLWLCMVWILRNQVKVCEIIQLNWWWQPYLWLWMMWIRRNQMSKAPVRKLPKQRSTSKFSHLGTTRNSSMFIRITIVRVIHFVFQEHLKE